MEPETSMLPEFVRAKDLWHSPPQVRNVIAHLVNRENPLGSNYVHKGYEIAEAVRVGNNGFRIYCDRFDTIGYKISSGAEKSDPNRKMILALRDIFRANFALAEAIMKTRNFAFATGVLESTEIETYTGAPLVALLKKARMATHTRQAVEDERFSELPDRAVVLNAEVFALSAQLGQEDTVGKFRGIIARYKKLKSKQVHYSTLNALRDLLRNHFREAPEAIKRTANELFEHFGEKTRPFTVERI